VNQNQVEKNAYDFSFKLNTLFTDVSYDNIVVGFNPSLLYRISTVMTVHGEFYGSYYNYKPETIIENSTAYNGIIAGDYVPYLTYNGGATFYLWEETYEGRTKFSLPKKTRNGQANSYFLEVEGVEKIRQFGLRLTAGKYQGQIAEKGLEFEGYNKDTLIASLDNSNANNYTSINYNLFSVGFSYEQINHLKINIKTDSLGSRSKLNHWRVYVDFLLARQMTIGEILYTWEEGGEVVNEVFQLQKWTIPGEDTYSMEYMGFRTGFEFNATGKVGFTYGVELGARPGTGNFAERGYINAKLGVSFNWRLINL